MKTNIYFVRHAQPDLSVKDDLTRPLNFDFKLSEGESLREVQERNVSALFDIINNNLGKNIAIGTHGTALCTIINYFNPDFGYADFLRIVDKMPYIICFRFDGVKLECIEEIEI